MFCNRINNCSSWRIKRKKDKTNVISLVNNKSSIPVNEKTIGFKRNEVENLPNPSMSNEKEFTSEDLKNYVNHIKSKNSNICDGYKKISKSLGMAENTGLKVKDYLENKGYLRVEGNKTLVNKDLKSIEFN